MDKVTDDTLVKAYQYTFKIIPHVPTFIDFSNAMLDFMALNFQYTKSIYCSLSSIPNTMCRFEKMIIWDNYTDGYILQCYRKYKRLQRERNIQKEFKDKIDELLFLIKEYRNTDEFQKMLDFVCRFHYLAPYNAMLVHIQNPGAELVTSVIKWRKFNRHPKPNAQKLIILITFYPVRCVFDYSDTEQITGSKEIPESKLTEKWDKGLQQENGEVNTEIFNNLISNLPLYGIYLDNTFTAANTYRGYLMEYKEAHLYLASRKTVKELKVTSRFLISVKKNTSRTKQFLTIAHELCHLFCHQQRYISKKRRYIFTKGKEFEAETTVWLIDKRLKIINSSVSCLSLCSKDVQIPVCSTDYIKKTITEIENMFSKKTVKIYSWYAEDKDFKKLYDEYIKN
jgi:hypothetical protein